MAVQIILRRLGRMDPAIKIYVSCHKDFYVPAHPLLFPVQVGAAGSNRRFAGMLHDDTGVNISAKNKTYCELTAQYWAWKNEKAAYYGFFHYRRYLNFKQTGNRNYLTAPTKRKKRPRIYNIYRRPDEGTLKQLGYDPLNITNLVNRYEVIAPVAEEMHVTVFDHYRDAPKHHIEDLELALAIIAEKYPGYLEAAREYMQSTKHYFCNLFIMKNELFQAYCSWLFAILSAFERRMDFSRYSGKSCRVHGWLGERLFGVYFTWLKKQPGMRWAELPRAHFAGFPGETDNFKTMKRINAFLPPGTRRRTRVKKLYRAAQKLLGKEQH